MVPMTSALLAARRLAKQRLVSFPDFGILAAMSAYILGFLKLLKLTGEDAPLFVERTCQRAVSSSRAFSISPMTFSIFDAIEPI